MPPPFRRSGLDQFLRVQGLALNNWHKQRGTLTLQLLKLLLQGCNLLLSAAQVISHLALIQPALDALLKLRPHC